MPETKVLIPLDGSPLAETALGALEALEALGPLRIRLVSVVEAIEGLTAVARDEHLKREENLLRAYLDGVVARLQSERKVASVDSVTMTGLPLEIILDQARDFAPDLLVISSHGRSGLSRWRLGSVADGVVRSQTANTLVVGPHGRLRAPVRSLLVGLDGSALSESALPLAASLATGFGATLHLVRVVPLPFTASEQYQDYLDELTSYSQSYLEEVRARLDFSGEVVLAARVGAPADRLIDYAAAHDINLAVITSHGRGGVVRAALGSVAGRLVGGPVPVLIVRQAGGSNS
jgi:nucleotide-binding universal stress UspA family protein